MAARGAAPVRRHMTEGEHIATELRRRSLFVGRGESFFRLLSAEVELITISTAGTGSFSFPFFSLFIFVYFFE